MILQAVERFVYFIVKNSRLFDTRIRNMHPLTKIKHYLYMSKYVADKYKFSFSKHSLYSQVLTAMDDEWEHLFAQHYVENEWNYYFESQVTLQTDFCSYDETIYNEAANVLSDYVCTDTTPTVETVREAMLESFNQDYIEFELDDESAEGDMETPHKVVMLPKDDQMVYYLNELVDEETGELLIDSGSERDAIDQVSNQAISDLIEKEFNEMVSKFNEDSELTNVENYIKMIEKIDLFTFLNTLSNGLSLEAAIKKGI